MPRYGTYDATRGLLTALAAGTAGFLLWVATQVGQASTGAYWGEMGIVAGAGLVLALLPALGGRTMGLRLRLSPGVFLLGFVPTLIVAGWVLFATQPGNGWHDGRVLSWSSSIGVLGLVHDLGLWHGVLAFGLGIVLGMSLDTVPVPETADEVVPARRGAVPVRDEPVRDTRRGWRRGRARHANDTRVADEPMTADRGGMDGDGERVPADREDRVPADTRR